MVQSIALYGTKRLCSDIEIGLAFGIIVKIFNKRFLESYSSPLVIVIHISIHVSRSNYFTRLQNILIILFCNTLSMITQNLIKH